MLLLKKNIKSGFKGLVLLLLINVVIRVIVGPVSRSYTVPNLPPVAEKQRPNRDDQYDSIIHLHDAKGEFFCTGFVVDDNYAITAGHCIDDKRYSKIVIHDGTDKPTGIKADAVGYYSRQDLGLIKGDFSLFNKLPVDTTSPALAYSYDDDIVSCGFPLGQQQLICVPFKALGPDGFMVSGIGAALYPGMSGGPTINMRTGKAIGINSAMGQKENFKDYALSYIAPTTGLYAVFGVEFKKE